MTPLLAGLALGLAGSVHCVAMCGPLMALTRPRGTGAIVYHGARTTSYVVIGILAGSAGGVLASAGAGQWIAVGGAVVLVGMALLQWGGRYLQLGSAMRGTTLAVRLIGRGTAWARAHPSLAPVALGALNGWLPCGLVYGAVVAAAGFGDPRSGATFMLGFGAGTSPLLLVAAVSFETIRARLSPRLRRLTPLALIVVAVVLAARGFAVTGHAH